MKRLLVLTLLVSVAMSAPAPTACAEPREEIRLTTIIPDQHVLRVRKGIISTARYRQADFPDGNIQDKALIIDEGNVGIGTTAPTERLTVAGTIESTLGGIKFPNGTTQTSAANASSRYKVKYKTNVHVYTPGGFSSPDAQYAISSFGTIQGSDGSMPDGSYLFTMNVKVIKATTKTLYLGWVDNRAYFFLDGSQIAGPWENTWAKANINYNLSVGEHTIQVIYTAEGGNDYVAIFGEIVDDVDVFYKN
jgi:hypothetical protein